jgi:hypothetical protein
MSSKDKGWGWIGTSTGSPSWGSGSEDDLFNSPRLGLGRPGAAPRSKSSARSLSLAVASALLGPFASFLLPSSPQSLVEHKKKSPLTLRLLSASYVIFSLLFFTSHLVSGSSCASLLFSGGDPRRLLSRGSPPSQLVMGSWSGQGPNDQDPIGRPWNAGESRSLFLNRNLA